MALSRLKTVEVMRSGQILDIFLKMELTENLLMDGCSMWEKSQEGL